MPVRHPAAILLLLASILSAAAPAATQEVDLDALRAHLDFLADDRLAGRDTGSEGYEVAALYAATRFRQFGLEPGSGTSFEQRVPLARVKLERSSFTVSGPDGARELSWKDDYLFKGSPTEPRIEVDAPVVFVGYGIDAPDLGHRDYATVDVRGKVVLLFSGAPASFPNDLRAHHSSRRCKEETAAAHGAVGIVAMRTRVDRARVPWERMALNAGRPTMKWKHPDGAVQDAFPPLRFASTVSASGAEALLAGSGVTVEALLDGAESVAYEARELPVRVVVEAESELSDVSSPNVVAVLPGSQPALAGEHVVITAHLDHVGVGAAVEGDDIYNGYYDNALGSSIVLEMARLLAASPQRPGRSILFLLVTGEEKGLLGSDYFAHHPTVPLDSIVANVNIDMPLLLRPVADLVAFGAEHSSLGALTESAATTHGFTLSPDPMPEEVIFVRSDQYSFVRQGVPALYLSPGNATVGGGEELQEAIAAFIAEHYHRPSDSAELGADWDSVRRFTEVNVGLVRAVAGAAERPRWNPGDFFGDTFAKPAAPQ